MSNGRHFRCSITNKKLYDDHVFFNEDTDEFECICHGRIPNEIVEDEDEI